MVAGQWDPVVEGRAFLSYVREDSAQVDRLQQVLQEAGIPVWRDKSDLWPGEDWRAKIRGAITDDALVFIACFSSSSLAKLKSYQNEELVLAVEQLRLRQPEQPWLIPVRFDDCSIPDRDLGGGRRLSSLQWVDLFGDAFDDGARRLVAAIRRILGPADAGQSRVKPERKLDALGSAKPTLAEGQPPAPEDILIPSRHVPPGPGLDGDTVRQPRMRRRRPLLIAAGTATAVAVVLVTVLLTVPGGNPVSPGTTYARAVLADDPVAYWQFDGAPGPAGYADASGNGHTLSAGLTTLAVPGIPDLAGAISTTAGGTSTTTSLRPLAGDTPRTLEAWFRTTANGCIFSIGLDVHTRAFALCLRDGPVNVPTPGAPGIYFETYDADIFIPAANLADGTWHYLAVTLTRNIVGIVIDGTEPTGYIWNGNASVPGGGTYTPLTTQPLTLPYTPDTAATPLGLATPGIGGIGSGLRGTIAEVAIYPSALAVSALFRHYQLIAG